MPIFTINNDQNIRRVYPKMSEDFSQQNNAKLTNSVDAIEYFDEINAHKHTEEEIDDTNIPYDHMYASNNENIESNSSNCHNTDESEVKFLKEWLILHLDLIQQQNDEILDKEKTILILKKENEMLKERINCMENGQPFKSNNDFNNKSEGKYIEENFSEAMTQDSAPYTEDSKQNVDLLQLHTICDIPHENSVELEPLKFEDKLSDTESLTKENELSIVQKEDIVGESEKVDNSEQVEVECENFTFENCSDFDPMRNLKMSIRRKRVYSNSSAFSNNDSLNDDKRLFRKLKKKRRRFTKDTQVISTPQPYITQAGETIPNVAQINDMPDNSANLEVPRWRIKHYVSCYTMEGTENMDDEVYNKRHMRLENDERRRKRWDVQRIREQRVVEKLKLRQERVGSGSRMEEPNEIFHSLWPQTEDVKFLEVSDELPVSAFGSPIPKIHSGDDTQSWTLSATEFNNVESSNDFSLPWLTNPSLATKPANNKRSAVKRKCSKR
ncbi:unnamed protein product [Brassicogethes aeneus]|uniref:PEHE domain-containing protein n=1 Tax=Brassicogethes aeneus TaxID=1431903 RepID=A0A9P0FI85_BRAAE|nr:unnamed protein product [Brassicogethes aeneus]